MKSLEPIGKPRPPPAVTADVTGSWIRMRGRCPLVCTVVFPAVFPSAEPGVVLMLCTGLVAPRGGATPVGPAAAHVSPTRSVCRP